MATDREINLQTLVAEVASAYFSNSHVGLSDIRNVIAQIAQSLAAIGSSETTPVSQSSELSRARATAAQVRKSITPEVLISFEDGRPYKTLRRHLSTKGLTPEAYREKWGLPTDYPMVAARYSEARSTMAKRIGLGARRAAAPEAAPTKRRGRAPAKTNA